jgi:DNA replication protein DnaD
MQDELNSKIEVTDETLESYSDFKKRYYIYRVDDIREYLQKDNTELAQLYEKNEKIFNELKETLNTKQKLLLNKYSDNCIELSNIEIDELTKYILNDFDNER